MVNIPTNINMVNISTNNQTNNQLNSDHGQHIHQYQPN